MICAFDYFGVYFLKMENKRIFALNLAIKKGFTYNQNTGEVQTPTGKIASDLSGNGYISLTVRDENSKRFRVSGHQFAWYVTYNNIVDCIDHINRIKTDNRIENLRSVSKSQNGMNRYVKKGYHFNKKRNKFLAKIMVNYKSIPLGAFDKEEDARNCYLINKEKYHSIKNK